MNFDGQDMHGLAESVSFGSVDLMIGDGTSIAKYLHDFQRLNAAMFAN